MAGYAFDAIPFLGKIDEYVTDKKLSARTYMRYMILRLQKMFKYKNLPETIPQEFLEFYLITNGTCFITKVREELYAFIGSPGGMQDVYYRPSQYIISNPALVHSGTYDIDDSAPPIQEQYNIGDGVLMRNDVLWMGLDPLMRRYASMLAENMLTIRTADIMLRVVALISAPDDKTRLAGEAYLKKLIKGELSVVGETAFFDGIKLQSPPSNNGSYLTQFIELQQYLIGSFYTEIGLDAPFNMKREAIGEGEAALNKDTLMPLCEGMLKCRQEDWEKVNSMFGTNVSVEFDSSWQRNIDEMQLELDKMKAEVDQLRQLTIEGQSTEEQSSEDQPTEEQSLEEQEPEESAQENDGDENE